MHEYSVVASLLELCLEHVKENGATSVQNIVVSIGERANIDKTLLQSAFEVLQEEYECVRHATLTLTTEELLLECRECEATFHSLDNPTCPKCASKNTHIIKGRDIRLEQLELEIDDERSAT